MRSGINPPRHQAYDKKPLHGCPCHGHIFRNLPADKYCRAARAGHHQQLSRDPHGGCVPGVLFLYCLCRDVDSSGLSTGTMMVVLLGLSKFPAVRYTAEETVGSWEMYLGLARKKVVWMYFISMFAYVGCEQGTADWISKFLSQYHGFDPQYHRRGGSLVVLGLDDGGVSSGNAAAEDLRQPPGPDRSSLRSIALPICDIVRTGSHFVAGISRDRSVRIGHVADRYFAGTQFRGRAPRLLRRNPGNGNGNWRSCCARNRRTHPGPRRIAEWDGIPLSDIRNHSQHGFWAKPLISNETMDLRKSKS